MNVGWNCFLACFNYQYVHELLLVCQNKSCPLLIWASVPVFSWRYRGNLRQTSVSVGIRTECEWHHRYPCRFCSEIISPVLYPMNRDISSFCRNNRDTPPCHTCAYSATWHPATFSFELDGICLLAHYLYIVNDVIGWAINLLPIAQSDATPTHLILKWGHDNIGGYTFLYKHKDNTIL